MQLPNGWRMFLFLHSSAVAMPFLPCKIRRFNAAHHNNSLVVEESAFFSSSFILQQQRCHSTNSVARTIQQIWNGFFPSDNSQFLVTSTKENCAFAKRRTSCLSLHPKPPLLFLQITKNAPPKNTNHFFKKKLKKILVNFPRQETRCSCILCS